MRSIFPKDWLRPMPSFPPDSFIVSDVVPSPNHDERKDGRPPDMILLHYTGMPTGEAAFARLACRRFVLGRRQRYQFALDRHRDRQSGARIRLSRFSAAADRGGDLAV